MGLLDFLVDELFSDDSDLYGGKRFHVTCEVLELFEIGTTWKGTARVHGAGNHVRTVEVNYSTNVTMPKEGNHDYTNRGLLRKELREWCGRTFANKSSITRETLVLNDGEDCLSCEGFVKNVDGKWIITSDSRGAEFYGAYKLRVMHDGEDVGHEDLDYYFKADTLGYVSSVDVHDGF